MQGRRSGADEAVSSGDEDDVTTDLPSMKRRKKAIDAPRFNGFFLDPDEVVIVGLDTPHKSLREHPLWDKRVLLPVNEGLAEAMMLYGCTTVIEVRKNGKNPDGEDILEVADGRQRTRAARLANERLRAAGRETIRIKAIYSRGEDATLFGHRISANEHRADDPPLDRARNYQHMLDMGRTEREAQVTFGITAETGRMWQRLLDLDAAVQAAVDARIVPATAAAELADLPREEQVKKLAELTASGGRITRAAVQGVVNGNPAGGGMRRPVLKKMIRLLEEDAEKDGNESVFDCPREDLVLLKWVTGQLSDKDAEKHIPWLRDAVTAATAPKSKG